MAGVYSKAEIQYREIECKPFEKVEDSSAYINRNLAKGRFCRRVYSEFTHKYIVTVMVVVV